MGVEGEEVTDDSLCHYGDGMGWWWRALDGQQRSAAATLFLAGMREDLSRRETTVETRPTRPDPQSPKTHYYQYKQSPLEDLIRNTHLDPPH